LTVATAHARPCSDDSRMPAVRQDATFKVRLGPHFTTGCTIGCTTVQPAAMQYDTIREAVLTCAEKLT